MISITEAYVDAAASNADSIKNARALVSKGKFIALYQSADGSLIFGECQGSGKDAYRCSSDFADAQNPTHRCSCPSRLFPCKHSLGLMYAYAMGKNFKEAEIPSDLTEKREKAAARAEKKAEEATKPTTPKKVNVSALKKKIDAQLKGLYVLDSLITDIIRRGLGTLDAKVSREIDAQAKQLADAFLPGAQGVLNEITALFRSADGRYQTDHSPAARDTIYREALERLGRAQALAKRGRDYLTARLQDPDLKPETNSSIAAWLGHAWQLTELEALGCMETEAELVQLSFEMEKNHARAQFVDIGIWLHLNSGKIYQTQNIRPWKAKAYIREEDSVFHLVQTPQLFIYPGEGATRVRWNTETTRDLTHSDYGKIQQYAAYSITEIVKIARDQLKSSLADRHVWVLIRYARIGKVSDAYVLEDASGARIELVNHKEDRRPAALPLMSILPQAHLSNQVLLGCLRQDWERNQLVMEPVSIITTEAIVRLAF